MPTRTASAEEAGARFVAPLAALNLILFEPDELDRPLPRVDLRARHLLEVLRRTEGEPFDAGIVNGAKGKGRIVQAREQDLVLSFAWDSPPPAPAPITLIIGLPRPQTARDVLRDATTLGVAALHFVLTERGERNYAQSTLWRSGEWRRHLRQGAEQAFCTRLPEVTHGRSLLDVLAGEANSAAVRLALDNYEAASPLSRIPFDAKPVCLCIGGERGWSAAERETLQANGFELVHLGERVLRTETACVAALTLLRAKLGLM